MFRPLWQPEHLFYPTTLFLPIISFLQNFYIGTNFIIFITSPSITLTMKKLIFSAIAILLYLSATAQMPERTPENIQKYKEICRKYIYKDMKGMYREAGGALKYPVSRTGKQPISRYVMGLGLLAKQHRFEANITRKRFGQRPPGGTQI